VNAVQDRPGGQAKTRESLFPNDSGTDRVLSDPFLGIQHRHIEARCRESISRGQPSRARPDHSHVPRHHPIISGQSVLNFSVICE
jgi:hypothetical protein